MKISVSKPVNPMPPEVALFDELSELFDIYFLSPFIYILLLLFTIILHYFDFVKQDI